MKRGSIKRAIVLLLGMLLLCSYPAAILAEEDRIVPGESDTSEEITSEDPAVPEEPAEPPAEDPSQTGTETETEENTSSSVDEETSTSSSAEETSSSSSEQETGSSSSSEESISSSEEGTSSSEETEDTSSEGKEEGTPIPEEKKTVPVSVVIEGEGEVTVLFTREGEPEEKTVYSREEGEEDGSLKQTGPTDPLAIEPGTELRLETIGKNQNVFCEWKLSKEGMGVAENRVVVPEEGLVITAIFKNKEEVESLPADGASREALEEIEGRPKKTNEELIAEQNIVALPVPKRDFRFWTIEKEVEFLATDVVIREDIRKDARVVAKGHAGDAVYVLEEVDTDWYYIESGDARGFLQKGKVLAVEKKKDLLREYIRRAYREAAAQKCGRAIDTFFSFAEATVAPLENKAYLYRKCTTQKVVIDKVYALAKTESVDILEEKKTGARICGTLAPGARCYVIAEEEDWLYVESGDVRGFVRTQDMQTGKRVQEKVRNAGEGNFAIANAALKPEENKATYYTFTSIKEGVPLHPVRDAIIKSAEQCLGHPYVWGGTSLLNGCDCSGFVQSLYAMYGYTIPRVAEDQARFGRQIPVSNAQPGDLIFFAHNGYVHHVALYVGDDQTIEAYGTAVGIIRNGVDHSCAVWATRVIED